MICLNNQEIQTNFGGANYITKVYAGENLVLGQDESETPDEPQEVITATCEFTTSNINGTKLQNTIGSGTATLQSSGQVKTLSGFIAHPNTNNTLTFSGLDNISHVEVVLDWSGVPDQYRPTNGTTVNIGEITHDTATSKSIWSFDGSTGIITYNNQNPNAYVKYTGIKKYTITVTYTA